MASSPRRDALLVGGLALALRLALVIAFDHEAADVRRYRRVAVRVLEGHLNPYSAPRLYPYPPVWVWLEAGAEWASRATGVGFPVLVKVPVVAADLGIVGLLLASRGRGAAWIYALHPVSLLVTGVHGQFDSLMLLPVLLAVRACERGEEVRAALALAAAIAVKSVPVLLLPFFLLALRKGSRARFAALCLAPVTVILVPYALDDFAALRRELFGYGGVADFGWMGLVRGAGWWVTGELARSEAAHWGAWIAAGKALFLAAYTALLWGRAAGRLRWSLAEASLAVFLAFQVFYGAVSAQYLLWVVPLALAAPSWLHAAYAMTAAAALLGFYAFLAPETLHGAAHGVAAPPEAAGRLWVAGNALVLAVAVWWLASLLRAGSSARRIAGDRG